MNSHRIVQKKVPVFLLCILAAFAISQCTQATIAGGTFAGKKLRDGDFTGYFKNFPNSAEVKVTIKDGRISDIVILSHGAWKGKIAEKTVIDRIIEGQSTKVDAVAGATNSSYVIMNAVEDAVRKSAGR